MRTQITNMFILGVFFFVVSCVQTPDNNKSALPVSDFNSSANKIFPLDDEYHLTIHANPYKIGQDWGFLCKMEIGKYSGFRSFSFAGFMFRKDSVVNAKPLFSQKIYRILSLKKSGGMYNSEIRPKMYEPVVIREVDRIPENHTKYRSLIHLYKIDDMIPAWEGKNGDLYIYVSYEFGLIGAFFCAPIQLNKEVFFLCVQCVW